MTAPPTSSRLDAVDVMIRALHSAGIWDQLEALYVPATHDSQAALLDWTGRHDAATVGSGAPTFVVDRGYHVDGIDDWIDLGFSPAQATRFKQNSAMVAMWARNAASGQTASGLGLLGVNAVSLIARGANNMLGSRINSATATLGGAVTTGHGLSAIDRASATSVQHYKDGVACGSAGSATSAALSSARFVLGQAGAVLPQTSLRRS